MRISTHKTDPGYANYLAHQRYEVCVDGRVLTCCFMADDELGQASYYVVDQLGKPVIECGTQLTRTVLGAVKIVDIAQSLENKVFAQSTEVLPDKIAVAPDVMVRDLR